MLSIIIPAYNEEKRIGKTLQNYSSFKDSEIIVILNGCTDNTLEIVKECRQKHPQITYLDLKMKGKGLAIISGLKMAKGDLIGFTDADGSTSAEEFDRLIQNLDTYDGIIASRWMKGSKTEPKQGLGRRIASRVFNLIVRTFFRLKFRDTQCGAKIFRKEAVKDILPNLKIKKWAFDIDLLYNLKKKGYNIREFPIFWRNSKDSTFNIWRDASRMLISIMRLK